MIKRSLRSTITDQMLTWTQKLRVEHLQKAFRKHQRENPDSKQKTAEEVRILGLVDATLEEMNLKVSSLLPHVKKSSS
jgi:hypothetical protein